MALLTAFRRSPAFWRQTEQLLSRKFNPVLSVAPQKHFAITRNTKFGREYGPEADAEKESEINHWVHERFVAWALLPLIPTALLFPNIVTDTALVTAMVLHTHWRLSGVAEDYIHGPVLPKIAHLGVTVLSLVTLGTLFYFNYFDIGFAEAARKIFKEL